MTSGTVAAARTSAPSDPDAPSAPLGAAVEVRNVFHIYREADVETVALRGVDLDVAPGEYVAIVGRSGSGKSTLLNLIAGADRPSAGSVRVDNVELGGASEAERARLRGRSIRHIRQAGNLAEFLDLREQMELTATLAGVPIAPDDVEAALSALGMAGRARRRPGELSGGEQQRAALAMALATQPRLLLADEISGELDQKTAATALDALDQLRGWFSPTIVAVTHDREVAARADRVLTMVDGRLSTSADDQVRTWR